MIEWALLGIPIGIVLLYIGSEAMVDGAKKLAIRLGVTPFVVGLTIVAIGSSAPEAITSLVSSENPEIIIGNIIGSNSANAGIAVGLAAIISPIACKFAQIRFEMSAMIIAVLVILALSLNGVLGFIDGIILLALLMVFIFSVYKVKVKEGRTEEAPDVDVSKTSVPICSLMIIIGMAALYFGASWFIDGAVRLAEIFGVSDLMIGLILVAVGSALPEICICLMAAYRHEDELVVSNIVGSIVFNSFFALGIGALFTNIPIGDTTLAFHIPVMIILALLVFLFVRTHDRVNRREGVFLFLVYAAYIALMMIFPQLTSGVL
ncbi:MAG: calcium/sodium antiporter [Methanomassiliicoccaceae archaeon]|nr:calcium/sodium antiporter [Methanomassiliicoccaceae archaeon]